VTSVASCLMWVFCCLIFLFSTVDFSVRVQMFSDWSFVVSCTCFNASWKALNHVEQDGSCCSRFCFSLEATSSWCWVDFRSSSAWWRVTWRVRFRVCVVQQLFIIVCHADAHLSLIDPLGAAWPASLRSHNEFVKDCPFVCVQL